MPMAEGKRGRRAPAGRSAQPKVSQGNTNVLHVNLDVRTGVPRASVVHTKQLQQQQQQPVVNGGCRTGVGGTPVFSHIQKSHTSSFHHHHHANQNNNINNNSINNNNNHPGHSYQSPMSRPSRSATSTTTATSSSSTTTLPCHYRESLDEPPKYDEIFNSHVYHMYQGAQQKPQRNYEKKPVKSYFLRHFPKAKTFNKLNSDNNSVNNSGLASSGLGGSASGRRGCYAEIHVPPSAPSNLGGVTHQPHPEEEEEEEEEKVPTTATQPRPQVSLHRHHHHHPIPQQQGAQPPNRKYTITLKPGHYKINVQWRSKTHPFRITLTPSKRGDGEAPPPVEEQPLYYGSCNAHQQYVDQDLNTSLPRRLVHRLLFRQHAPPLECSYSQEQEVSHQQMTTMPSMTSHLPQYHPHQQVAHHLQLQQQVAQQQHQLLQQQVGVNPAACVGDRKGQKRCWEGGPRHRQRKSRYRLAERKKNEGNELYKAKDYREALKLYTQAIDLCPDCAAYYSNRSACYMMLGKYHDALNDAREAVRLDNTFVKGYLRVAKCNIALGDANAALSVLRQAGELEPTNRIIRDEMNNAQSLLRCLEEVAKATAKTDYRTAIFHLDRALDQAVGCRNLKITKAEYLVFLQRFADAQEMVNEILQFDSGNADAIYVRGMCLYYQDNPEAAFNHFQHVLRLAPDHQKARDIYKKAKHLKQKKEEGNDAFKRGSFQDAYNLYTDSLAIDPLNKHTNAKLYFNRATVGSKLNKLEQAIEDCTAAINLDEGYVKAYLRRAKCYQTLDKHDEAVRDYEKVARLDRSQEHKRLLHESKIQLKRSKRKDYYKILGVGKNASDDEIKKSYRKMALVHHPDRHASASDTDKREHEIKFKEIGEAYAVLTDAKKRAMYDRGQDINDPDGGFGHEADIDPNQIFQAFFGGHGGHGFGAHASFQQGGFPGGGFSGGSFPGGFHFQFG